VISNEMACQELVELVTEYLDGTLPELERARFEEHLAGCEGCQTYLEQMRQTISLCGRLTEESIPSEAKRELLHIFRTWKQS
jgi:anti-sigma factor RsiW